MSALGGSGRAAPKEEVRVWTQSGYLTYRPKPAYRPVVVEGYLDIFAVGM